MVKAVSKNEMESDILHPKYAKHLIGHQEIEALVLRQFNEKRLPHALLLTGKKGIGKATFAYRLARFLLAPHDTGISLFGDALSPESLYIAPEHPVFRKTITGSHPDLLVIEAEDIKIELARKIPEFLSLTPAESNWRVVIIDSAEAMNRNAANALLKILEEPSAQAVLLLVSHNPGALLPTIRSRCRMIKFPALKKEDFTTILSSAAPETTAVDYPKWATFSSCSPGIALELIQEKADILYQELLEIITAKDTVKMHVFTDRFARKDAHKSWEVLKQLMLWLIARIVSVEVGSVSEVFSGEIALLRSLHAGKPAFLWHELWEKTQEIFMQTEHLYLDRKQAIITLLRLW